MSGAWLLLRPATATPDVAAQTDRAWGSRFLLARARVQSEPPTWASWQQALAVITYPPHLRKTIAIALVVGTILFCINQLDVVVRGDATTAVWIKSAVTYLVPFCVSNAGVLVASRVEKQ